MILSAYLGVSGLAATGYSFYDSSETIIGSRVTTDIVDAGGGWYSTDTASVPTLAASVRWDDTGDAAALAREYFVELNQFLYNRTGTATAGAAGTITLDAAASASDDFYNSAIILLTGGTGVGQSRIISDYVGSTKVASVNGNWATNPASGTEFVIIPFGSVPGATAPTAAENADAVWDEARAGHVGAGSFGEYVLADVVRISGDSTSADNLESYTDGTTPIPANATQLSGDSTAADNAEAFFDGTGYAGTGNTIPNVTTVTNLTNAATAGDLTATMKASVNTEADTALTDYGALKPTVASRTLDVTATGEAGIDWANIGSPTTAQNLSATNIDVDQVVASVSGNVGGNVAGSVASVTGNVGGNVTGSVGSVAADGITSSSLATSAVNEIVDQTWDEAIAGHLGAGSTGAALNASGAAGDPWSTALPGAYGAGTAGHILGNMVTSVWNTLLTSMTTLGSIGSKLANWVICRCGPNLGGTSSTSPLAPTNMTPTFEQLPGGLNMTGVVGNDIDMDVLFEDTNLTGYTFVAYIVLTPSPLEKRYTMTVTNVDLAQGQIRVSLTDTQTTEIGPVSGKPWYLQWDDGLGEQRNVLMGRFQLNRF
jgi:hypothetical protein